MSTDQTMSLLYLGLLGTVIGAGFLLANRHRLGQMAQQAAIWGFIFLGTVLAYGLWDDIEATLIPQQSVVMGEGGVVVEVPRQRDGHYHLVLGVNGTPIPFIVDTGATDMVLSQQDAAAAGIDVDALRWSGRAFTANGEVETARVRLAEVALGEMVDRNVNAVVNGGALHRSLLGMSYLGEFGRIEIEDDTLRLIR
jgi:aspartyl protease family protein